MKKDAVMIKCSGEAHGNIYIDNCGVCMPYWGMFPVCPVDNEKLKHNSGHCGKCKKFYKIKKL